jgi:UDP-N-acetylglucosamine:LPS N-acetylglucosamine transferase
LKDQQVVLGLGDALKSLLGDPETCAQMAYAIQQAARPDAASHVVDVVESLIQL